MNEIWPMHVAQNSDNIKNPNNNIGYTCNNHIKVYNSINNFNNFLSLFFTWCDQILKTYLSYSYMVILSSKSLKTCCKDFFHEERPR